MVVMGHSKEYDSRTKRDEGLLLQKGDCFSKDGRAEDGGTEDGRAEDGGDEGGLLRRRALRMTSPLVVAFAKPIEVEVELPGGVAEDLMGVSHEEIPPADVTYGGSR